MNIKTNSFPFTSTSRLFYFHHKEGLFTSMRVVGRFGQKFDIGKRFSCTVLNCDVTLVSFENLRGDAAIKRNKEVRLRSCYRLESSYLEIFIVRSFITIILGFLQFKTIC